MRAPIIGITVDNRENTRVSGTYEVAVAYGEAVSRAGGVPILLPHEIEQVGAYLRLCQGLILTGGVDPDTQSFGEAMHPRARRMDPARQAFELALLDGARAPGAGEADDRHAVLGVCLGMQLMALHGGGALNQYLPDTLERPEIHAKNSRHSVELLALESPLFDGCGEGNCEAATVVSSHQQAVADAGRLRIAARAADGVIEAIDDPVRAFYGGVQWHPERGGEGPLNAGLIGRLVRAARCQTSS